MSNMLLLYNLYKLNKEKVNVERIGKQTPLKSLCKRNLKCKNSINKHEWKK